MLQDFIKSNDHNFCLFADSMPQIVWITTADGKNIYFNHQWVEYTGLTVEESYGDGWNKPFHPDDQKRSLISWQNATKNHETYSLECRLRRKDGEYKWWLVRGVPVMDGEATILNWIGTCTDIEQIKLNEITSRQNELRFKLVLESAIDYAIFMLNPEGIIQTWNIGAERIYAFKAHEIIGKHFSILFGKEQLLLNYPNKILGIALRNGKFSEEAIRIKKDGSTFLADINISTMYDEGNHIGFSSINRDLYEREAAKTNKTDRENYVMNLVHDLRTPLTGAIMNAQIIQKANIGFLKIISSLDRVSTMVSNLLDANTIESGNPLNLHFEYCDLQQIIMDVVADLTLIHGRRFILKESNSVSGYWSIDGLRRVIENLLTNAVKYGVTLSPINIMIEKNQNSVSFSIQNLGKELSSVEQLNIIEHNQRLKKNRNINIQGWGIGLTLVKGIIEAHGGSIALESESEKGTTFTITIPLDSRLFDPSLNLIKASTTEHILQ